MVKKNILILCGGNSAEHDISLKSKDYLFTTLKSLNLYSIEVITIGVDSIWRDSGNRPVKLNNDIIVKENGNSQKIDFVIPCIHGFPGETGDIQSLLEMNKIPYLGANSESSKICFNKATSKLWFDALDIPNTPYKIISHIEEIEIVKKMFKRKGKLFLKTSSQGSSVGCYNILKESEIEDSLNKALAYSPYVLAEELLDARELEIAAYEYKGKIHISDPGEIICPSKFYSFEEKYNKSSHTKTIIKANNIDELIKEKMKKYALKAFTKLHLKHLSRVDFFLESNGNIYLNEINTFPGMTTISMFPKMMETDGVQFKDFLEKVIENSIS